MKLLATLALTLLMLPLPARANFNAATLDAISATPPSGAALPRDLRFIDESGQPTTLAAFSGVPTVVIFADYTCHTLCGPILDFVVAGLASTGLRPSTDFHLVVIGLDSRDDFGAPRAMRSSHLDAGDPIGGATIFLTGTDDAIRSVTGALGYRYAYDAEHDQFAHPAAAYIADAQGRVTRVLPALALNGADFRLALVEAGRGAIGTVIDQIHLLCYGYDPVRGIYTERITFFLEIGTAAIFLLMIAGILIMLAVERRRAAP